VSHAAQDLTIQSKDDGIEGGTQVRSALSRRAQDWLQPSRRVRYDTEDLGGGRLLF
jgi:hypothetical protein